MVTTSICTSAYIPTVIIKSISVLLHGAELRSCNYSNSLFVDYWQDTGTCQQHVRGMALLSVESHHEAWHSLLSLFLSLFFVLPLEGGGAVGRHLRALLTQDFLTVAKANRSEFFFFFFFRMLWLTRSPFPVNYSLANIYTQFFVFRMLSSSLVIH